ncbi:uncharacterized protein LOC124171263 [Ischnura elegans]|uniref:uncharacterized protein LOC124171263 n=1 Tax=Ischnura elegans TaxID=197161 RepID=UPI001ED89899|nr:uncharacterized protein LOC124171263 [Ischnura elegans]
MFGAASDFYAEVASVLANDGTSWSFVPPNSPHFGGLWEAGVKSTKNHLLRVVGEHTLTFEEFSTVLIQIEACLNSRPLHPLSSDPDDLNALTPAHFLVGGTLFLIPEPECPNISGNCLSRWRLLQRLQLNFWKRWSREYLQHLQQRTKWRDPKENFTVGQLVIVRDDRYPPSMWPLGRITEVHPGPDALVRVVTVKMANTTLQSPIVRLSPVPIPAGQ